MYSYWGLKIILKWNHINTHWILFTQLALRIYLKIMSTFKESDSFVSVQVLVQYLVFITMYVLIFVIKKTPLLFSFLGQSSLIHFKPSLIYFSSKTVGLCTRLTPFIHPSFHILDASSTVFNTFLPELNHCEIIIL